MQNKAIWLETTPAGYKVRVGFTPMNPAEAVKCKKLLENCSVVIAGLSTEGAMSVDLLFLPKVATVPAKLTAPAEPEIPKAQTLPEDACSAKCAEPSANTLDQKSLDSPKTTGVPSTEGQSEESTKKETIQ